MSAKSQLFPLVVAILINCPAIGAADDEVAESFSKERWRIVGWYCPVGCSMLLKSLIDSQVGASVEVSLTKLNAPFLDQCNGDVHLTLKRTSPAAVAEQVNRGAGPSHKATPQTLRIGDGSDVISAIAYCKSGRNDLPFARFLSIEPERLLILFEEQSVIELR